MKVEPPGPCMADVVLRALRGRWATHILTVVAEHERIQFNELRREIPQISAKVLTEQLKYLVASGVLVREQLDHGRKEVIYSYTQRGHELKQALDGLNALAVRWTKP